MMTETDLRPEPAEWHWLRPHLKRDAVIVVTAGLDLTEVARRIAADDTDAVGAWIAGGELAKPSREQLAAWDAEPARRFAMLVVRPWVLIQETAAKE